MHGYHPYSIFPLGDAALTIDFGNLIDEAINRKVVQLFHQLRQTPIPYVLDLVPAYSSLTIYYDVSAIFQNKEEDKTAFETMAEMIETLAIKEEYAEKQVRSFEIPVCYAEKFALDGDEICRHNRISFEELIAIHTRVAYRVYMIGFLPGFSYLGEVDERIAMPRREEPRTILAAGSIGIAGRQTGIYPLDSPGGWQIIGRTPVITFDRKKDQPVLFQPGDHVKFYSITEDEFAHY